MTNACHVIRSPTFFDVPYLMKIAAMFVVGFDCASFSTLLIVMDVER